MANPLTQDVLVDPVVLTRALVDIESVSRDEKVIADCVEDVLRQAPHLSVDRLGNTVMARTDLGREQRVVLAGHLDTVPINDNFPSTVVDDLIYGCGTSDMKSGVALALHLAATLPDPCYDITYLFYEAEEIESVYNGLNLVSQAHPEWLAGGLRGAAGADVRGGRGRLPGHAAGAGPDHRPPRAHRACLARGERDPRDGRGAAAARGLPSANGHHRWLYVP